MAVAKMEKDSRNPEVFGVLPGGETLLIDGVYLILDGFLAQDRWVLVSLDLHPLANIHI